MKNLRVLIFLALGLTALTVMSGCGNSNTTSASSTTCATGYTYSSTYLTCLYTGTTGTTCASGYIYSSTYASCLQQTTGCEGLYAIYNGSCVLATTTTTTTSTTHSPYQGTCSYGYVQTSAGCLSQGVCTTGYGFGSYSGQAWCYPATSTY